LNAFASHSANSLLVEALVDMNPDPH